MAVTSNEELVKRIARLARQNQELEEQLKKIIKLNEKLTSDNDKLKQLAEKASPGDKPGTGGVERKERSLKFNMATVLFADIKGLSILTRDINSTAMMDELDEIIFDRTVCPSSKTAHAVSSHDVSIPSVIIRLLNTKTVVVP